MIKAAELRIGNKMYLYGSIATIHPSDFTKWASKESPFELNAFEPIPLSEEILLKAGFVFRKELDSAYIKRIFLWEREYIINIQYASIDGKDRFFTSMSTLTDDYTYNGGEIEDITYNDIIHDIVIQETVSVHQLQNLIHALTGEELTINL